MDLVELANRALMYPSVESARRKDEYYVSTSCGVEVPAPWGGTRIYGACHRAEWYRNRDVEVTNPMTPENARKAYWGNYLAEAEMDLYRQLGIYITHEKKLWIPEYFISGRIDCFVRNPDSWKGEELIGTGRPLRRGEVVGVEHKSTWQYGAKVTIDVKAGQKPWPKWEHIIQCAIYHWFYRSFAQYWQLVYMSRDTGRCRSHNIVVLDDDRISVNAEIVPFTIQHIFVRLTKLGKDLQLEEPPGRDFRLVFDKVELGHHADAGEFTANDTEKIKKNHKVLKGDWQCKWCRWASHCWEGVQLPYDVPVDRMLK